MGLFLISDNGAGTMYLEFLRNAGSNLDITLSGGVTTIGGATSINGILTMGSNIAMGGNNISGGGTFSATTLTGTLSTAAQTNVTSVGSLTGLTVTGTSNLGSSGANYVEISGGSAAATVATNAGNLILAPANNRVVLPNSTALEGNNTSGTALNIAYVASNNTARFGEDASLVGVTIGNGDIMHLIAGVYIGSPAGGDEGVGTLNIGGPYYNAGSAGVTCGPGQQRSRSRWRAASSPIAENYLSAQQGSQ